VTDCRDCKFLTDWVCSWAVSGNSPC